MKSMLVVGVSILLGVTACGSGSDGTYTTGEGAHTYTPTPFSRTYKFPTPSPSRSEPPSPVSPTPSATKWATTPPAPDEPFIDDAFASGDVELTRDIFGFFCSYPLVVEDEFDKYLWGDWWFLTEGLEVALTLMGFDSGPADGYASRKTAEAVDQALVQFGVEPEPKLKRAAWRKLTNVACWGPRDEYDASFDFWVANWPNGLEVMKTGSGDQSENEGDPTDGYMQRLWGSSTPEFRQAQCRMWRADPQLFAVDSIIALESGASPSSLDAFMARNC